MRTFVQSWYGDPTSPAAVAPGSPLAPPPLKAWHDIAAQWDGVITSHNYPVALPELRLLDGMVEFWGENQGCWVWGFDPHDTAHPVYEQPHAIGPWRPTGANLAEFLEHATMIEATFGAPVQLSAVSHYWIPVSESPFRPWNWPAPGARVVVGGQWLAFVYPEQHGHSITLAARKAENLAWAEGKATWRRYEPAACNDEPAAWTEPPW
ncbi:hypothetical protein LWC34_51915 [Kibdelosporangium philippinense]|uniref:SMI1/KNR4 family protein n=1 Tax=Kibdelosporangium philippinense TaxID=211113 RepID=A0ABS8ZYM6_9PSEU|nr:hypothetical protein [Kibdelosporangium philippinense]MCE7011262.1 hypothetical protein [Kibdelosporangium philippinense]